MTLVTIVVRGVDSYPQAREVQVHTTKDTFGLSICVSRKEMGIEA